MHPTTPINLHDYATLAQARMRPEVWDTFAQGSEDERTLRANEDAFSAYWLRPRALVETGACDTTTSALGEPLAFPAMIAPMSLQAMAHPEGELATARAAHALGTLLVASTLSSRSLEEIAVAADGAPLWFQLYLYPSERVNERLVRRVEQAGYRALVLTVDTPAIGNRERDRRNGFAPGADYPFGNFAPSDQVRWDTRGARAPMTWQTIEWLRQRTSLPIVLKGILRGDDAARAVAAGVKGVIVSNHGGRQLDGAPPTLLALPEVVAAVANRCEVFVDGGVRRGADILKALALGARAVLIGRPILWGLAVDGEHGVVDTLRILREELALAMRLAGCASVGEVDGSLIMSAADRAYRDRR